MTQLNGTQQGPLSGKVFAITGGASGIGLATAKILATRGATVCIADVDPVALKEAESLFGSHGLPFMVTKVDVSKRTQVDSWIESIIKTHGRLDGAANVAGVIGKDHGIAAVSELEDEEWDKIIGVNLTGTMYCLRAELRNIADGGSIVNVSSIHGLKGPFTRMAVPNMFVSLTQPRIRKARRIRCEQAWHGRTHKSGSAGKRRPRDSRQQRCTGGYLHTTDAKELGLQWSPERCAIR